MWSSRQLDYRPRRGLQQFSSPETAPLKNARRLKSLYRFLRVKSYGRFTAALFALRVVYQARFSPVDFDHIESVELPNSSRGKLSRDERVLAKLFIRVQRRHPAETAELLHGLTLEDQDALKAGEFQRLANLRSELVRLAKMK